jgi:hypothetical protein
MHAGCALSLIAIAAGMFLMAYSKKENLSNIYKYVSIFIVGCGFLCLLCGAAHCAMRCCHRGGMMGMHRERMMMDDDDGYMMGHMGGHGMMGHRGMMRGYGMMHGGCDEMGNGCPMMGGSCQENMGGCNEGMGNCHEGMGECKDDKGGSCPMMKGDAHVMSDKKDSVKKK